MTGGVLRVLCLDRRGRTGANVGGGRESRVRRWERNASVSLVEREWLLGVGGGGDGIICSSSVNVKGTAVAPACN